MADDRTSQLLAALLDGAHLAPPDRLPSVVRYAASAVGWQVAIYLVDYEQRALVRWSGHGDGDGRHDVQSVEGTMAGRAFRHIEPTPARSPDGARHLWVPIIDGVDRLGVLDVQLAHDDDIDAALHDPAFRDRLRWFAHLVGHLIGSKGSHGDALHRTRLTHGRTVASELVWSMLPPLTVACEGVVISGLLEPQHAVAGDMFDYAVDGGLAHAAIIDATGHDLSSSVIGAIAVAAYRNQRRASAGLADTVQHLDDALRSYQDDTYATAVLGRLDLASGAFSYANAGHPAPLLVRDGRVVKELDAGRRPLLGLGPSPVVPAVEQLQRGDWIVLYTDGVVEARDPAGAFFGLDRFIDVIERRAANREPAPETLRAIMHTVLEHQRGVLQDDATMVVIQWASEMEQALDASSG